MKNSADIKEIKRKLTAMESLQKHRSVREVFSSPSPTAWMQILGDHSLNASPSTRGNKNATTTAWTDPGALSPGACDPVTAAQTVAPSGTFTVAMGLGFANYREGSGPWRRVLVQNIQGGIYPYDMRSGMVFLATPLDSTTRLVAGVPTQFYYVLAP